MSYRIRVSYGIGKDRDNNPIETDIAVAAESEILTMAARIFGGATISDTRGSWIDESGHLVIEQGRSIVIMVDDLLKTGYDRIAPLISLIKSSLNQSVVLWSVQMLTKGELV